MVIMNRKKQALNYKYSIKKSNDLSKAKVNHVLSLNQVKLLSFAIYSTQQNRKNEFTKAEFERKFEFFRYQTVHAKEDTKRLIDLKISTEDLENDLFKEWNVFQGIRYKEGLFSFQWSEDMIPHILELKEKFVVTDLLITAKFKSSFTWTLYDYLRAHYGYWHKILSKEELMKLFNVEDKKTYQINTGKLKSTVLDVAIKEINAYTELEVRYEEKKQGRKIVGFDLIWSTGVKVKSASKKQIEELKAILATIQHDKFNFINLNDQFFRNKAVTLLRESAELRSYVESATDISSEEANRLIHHTTDYHRQLVTMVERENNGRNLSLYYDWIHE